MFAGFGLAVVVAVPLGLLMGTISLCYRLLEPITEFIRPIPAAAYIPVAILFLGIGNEMKIFVVFLACLFPILLNTYGGVRGIDPVLVDTGRTFGVSRLKALWQIVFPAALPSILTGMRISLGIALIVAVVSEMIAGNSGIGYFILDMQRIFRVPDMFAGIFTLGLLGFLINFVVSQDRAAFPALARHQRGDLSMRFGIWTPLPHTIRPEPVMDARHRRVADARRGRRRHFVPVRHRRGAQGGTSSASRPR